MDKHVEAALAAIASTKTCYFLSIDDGIRRVYSFRLGEHGQCWILGEKARFRIDS